MNIFLDMMQTTNQNADNQPGTTAEDAKTWPLAVVALCLVAVVMGWSVNFLLVVNDGALQIFIETLLPVFQWLLRLPEHFVV